MEVKKTLMPGDSGTKRLLDIYGDSLVCVRYRYDESSAMRYTTVELIADKKPYSPRKKVTAEVV